MIPKNMLPRVGDKWIGDDSSKQKSSEHLLERKGTIN